MASAPGKLVLFGEYAVLEGAPALVMATPHRAQATFEILEPHAQLGGRPIWHIDAMPLAQHACIDVAAPDATSSSAHQADGTPMPPALMWAAALLRAVQIEAAGALPAGRLSLDTHAFYHGATKLGLGSSAAIFVAAYQALRAAAGLPARPAGRAIATLRRLHSAAQGGHGSGVDVAASYLGGLTRYQLVREEDGQGMADDSVRATPVQALPGVHLLPVWTGTAAQTGPYLARFAELRAQHPARYWAACEELALISRAACELWAMGATEALLPLVPRSLLALEHLEQTLALQIVTPIHQQAARIAVAAGAYYKPSGAGGGDFGLVFAATLRIRKRAERALLAQGLRPMPMPVDVQAATGTF